MTGPISWACLGPAWKTAYSFLCKEEGWVAAAAMVASPIALAGSQPVVSSLSPSPARCPAQLDPSAAARAGLGSPPQAGVASSPRGRVRARVGFTVSRLNAQPVGELKPTGPQPLPPASTSPTSFTVSSSPQCY